MPLDRFLDVTWDRGRTAANPWRLARNFSLIEKFRQSNWGKVDLSMARRLGVHRFGRAEPVSSAEPYQTSIPTNLLAIAQISALIASIGRLAAIT